SRWGEADLQDRRANSSSASANTASRSKPFPFEISRSPRARRLKIWRSFSERSNDSGLIMIAAARPRWVMKEPTGLVARPHAVSPCRRGAVRGRIANIMKLGLFLPLAGDATRLRAMITVAATVGERAGFHSLWFAEHVALFDAPGSRYPYSADGSFPLTGEVGIVEPFVAIAFAAALTTRIRLGTGICLVPQRPPLYPAKQVADADVL